MTLEQLQKLSVEQILIDTRDKLSFLESHNKNYTKKQYYTILEVMGNIIAVSDKLKNGGAKK